MQWGPQQEMGLDRAGRWLRSGTSPVFHMFGYAGTGKTTLAKHIASQVNGTVLYGAFTGKASYVLRTKGCAGASTIHSMIYISKDRGTTSVALIKKELDDKIAELISLGLSHEAIENHNDIIRLRFNYKRESDVTDQPLFRLNHESPVKDADLIIIDECSMVDNEMGADLLSFGTPVLVLGDPAQLPPVFGEGYFTKDVQPDVMLTEIHRQAAENPIIRMATDVRNGKDLAVGDWGNNCHVYPEGTKLSEEETLSFDQILVGKNKTRFSVNSKIRKMRGCVDGFPVVGDRLVCLKNYKEEGLLNGQILEVSEVDGVMDQKVQMSVTAEDDDFSVQISAHEHYFLGTDERLGFYEKKEAMLMDYGYGLTVHKSQGSQWDKVMLLDEGYCFRKDKHKWRYTGITRAAENLSVIKM